MLASDVVNLVESNGIGALTTMYQISRRQAEQFEIQARRLLAYGSNPVIVPGDASGTVRTHQRTQAPSTALQDDQDPAEQLEQAAQAHVRRIRAESAGLQLDSIGKLRGRVKLLERNVAQGYRDWDYDLRLSKRTLEVLDGMV
jgi:hypothetical protein